MWLLFVRVKHVQLQQRNHLRCPVVISQTSLPTNTSLFFEVLFQMFSSVKVMLLVLSILDGFHGLQLLDLSSFSRISDDNSFKFLPVGTCLSLRNHWVMDLLHSKAVLFSSNWSKILYGTLSNFVHLYFVKVFLPFFYRNCSLQTW